MIQVRTIFLILTLHHWNDNKKLFIYFCGQILQYLQMNQLKLYFNSFASVFFTQKQILKLEKVNLLC